MKAAPVSHPKSSVNLRVLITGASGALGGELALRLAQPGSSLMLWGRRCERLDELVRACQKRGAKAEACALDLADLPKALAMLAQQDDAHPYDVVLLVAGQGDTLARNALVEDPAQVSRLGHANFVAPAAMAAAIATRMTQRRRGRIGLVGTAAASHSLPFAAAYAGSKAGLARFADALRLAVTRHGVSVTLITPGFFTEARFEDRRDLRPGEISAGAVAKRMITAVMAGRAELVVPRRFLLLRWLDRFLPRIVRDRLLLALRLP